MYWDELGMLGSFFFTFISAGPTFTVDGSYAKLFSWVFSRISW
jgi:hypothetical protein